MPSVNDPSLYEMNNSWPVKLKSGKSPSAYCVTVCVVEVVNDPLSWIEKNRFTATQ